jgi:hypothetical protein
MISAGYSSFTNQIAFWLQKTKYSFYNMVRQHWEWK